MGNMLTYLLVFGGAAAVGYVVVSTLEAAAFDRAAAEERNKLDDGVFPYSYFTTPRKLARTRLFAGYGAFIAAFVFVSLLGGGLLFSGAAAVAAGIAGAWLPLKTVKRRLRLRQEKVAEQVLDLTTGLAGGLRSGQALPAALESMAGRLQKPMSEEIATVLREYRLGIDLSEALARMAKRVPGEDLTLLVGSIRLTQQAGGSLAEVLDKMVGMIRGRVEFQAKLKAMTSQGRFEAIAMSLAPIFVFAILYLIDKPLMLPMVTTTVGWIAIVCDAVWVIIGFSIIQKIVTIEV